MCPTEGQAGSRQGCSRQHLQLTQARCQGLEWLHSLLLHSDICDWGPLSLHRRLLCCALRSLCQKLANKKQRELKKLLKANVWKKHTPALHTCSASSALPAPQADRRENEDIARSAVQE